MNEIYPIQLIALDKSAHQALDLAEPAHFAQTVKTDIPALFQKLVSGYRQVLVLSTLPDDETETLFNALREMEEPVVLLPESYQGSEVLKLLALGGVRVVLAPSDSLTSVSLSQALRLLEALLYGNDPENEMVVAHEDIYAVIPRGSVCELQESTGANLSLATLRMCNDPKGYQSVAGAYVLYYVAGEVPVMEISEAMEAVEGRLPEDAALIFGTRNTSGDAVRIVCLLSRRYDFAQDISERMKQRETYLEKLTVLVDAFIDGEIDVDEAEYLANAHHLAFKDVGTMYSLMHTQPEATVALLQRLQDDSRDLQSKVEMLADAVYEENVNITIAEGLVHLYALPLDSVLEAIRIKREGKMPLHGIELSESVRHKFPHLVVAKSEDTVVLLARDEPTEEGSGILSVDAESLTRYRKDDLEWLVSRKVTPEDAEAFIKEYFA